MEKKMSYIRFQILSFVGFRKKIHIINKKFESLVVLKVSLTTTRTLFTY